MLTDRHELLGRRRSRVMMLLGAYGLLMSACRGESAASHADEKLVYPPVPSPVTATASSPATATAPHSYEGYYDITNCNGILGWAWDVTRPNDPIRVDVYDGTRLLATVSADMYRPDLQAAGKGNGKHGFLLPTPVRLKDGKPHVIFLRYAGTRTELANGPKQLTCNFD